MNTTGKIIAGFIVGTAIGVLTGLLAAPASGTRTRKNINKKAKKLVKQIEGLVASQKRKTSGLVQHAKNHAKNGKAPVSAS